MTHNEQNIDGYHAGDALEIHVKVEDSQGNVVDLTNASAEYLVKENATDSDVDALVHKTVSGGGITITGPDTGDLRIDIATNDTSGMNGQKHHRLRITDADGDRSTVFTGTLTIVL